MNKRQIVSKKILKTLLVVGIALFIIISIYSMIFIYTETKEYINKNNISNNVLLTMLQQYTLYVSVFSISISVVALIFKGFGATTTVKKVLKVIKYYAVSFVTSFITVILGTALSISPLNNWKLSIGAAVYFILIFVFLLIAAIPSDAINKTKNILFNK